MLLNEDQTSIRDMARQFAQERLKPFAADWDREHRYPAEAIAEMAELGFFGMLCPEQWGGSETGYIAYALALEEIAAGDGACSTIMSVHNSVGYVPILRFGKEEQKQRYLTPLASGAQIGAFALTEPQSGSDATAMRCRAVKQDDGSFVVNGKKSWITSGPVAKYIVLFAMTDPDKHARGITAFLVDTTKPGFHRGKTEPKLGIRASATCEIEFQDFVCAPEDVLGEEGHGFKIAMSVLDAGRIGIASQAIGIARAAYEATLDYARERKAFGQPIGAFQMTQAKIADMKCKLDASLLLTLRAAWLKGQGKRFTTEAAVAKLTASEAAMWITHQALQIHAGMGYSKEMPIERYFRDAKITEIYEGTSEIQRLVIARHETGLR